MKPFGFTNEANHGKTNKKKPGNSDDTQISRPDLHFASREKQRKQDKTGPEPHQTKKHTIPWGLPPFFPSNARWLSPGRLSSRKDNCILQIHRIKAVATSIMTTMCLPKRIVDLCVSSLRRGHANLLCIVPILSDVFFPSDASWLPPGRSTRSIACCRDKWID